MYADAEEQLSERLSLTPEGFLRVHDAVMARTGRQEYFTAEVPTLDADDNGWVIVDRPEAEVFSERSLKSYIGKPVVLMHPDTVMTPDNIRAHQIGTVLSARRGEGDGADTVVGDLMITDAHAIALIRRGTHRALSAGYDASYVQHGRGFAEQRGIRINHVALLANGTARCGPRCAIGDRRARMLTTDAVSAVHTENWTPMGANPDPRAVGGELLAEVEGPISALILLPRPGNKVGVFKIGSSTNVLDPGRATTGVNKFTADMQRGARVAQQRIASEQARNKQWADNISGFWKARAANG
jgi:hypothetical protein